MFRGNCFRQMGTLMLTHITTEQAPASVHEHKGYWATKDTPLESRGLFITLAALKELKAI
jgi:hypothetical protein